VSLGRERRRRLTSRRAARGRRRLPAGRVELSAIALIGAAVPMAVAGPGTGVGAAPSSVLCSGWASCAAQGYDSYGYGQNGWQSYWQMSAGDECTNYVAYIESTVFGAPAPDYLLGNGGQWAASAAANGVVVNDVPSVGAVAEWDGGTYGMGPLGHVAVVESVGPHDSYIVISQQNISSDVDGYDWTRINAGFPADEWQEWPSNFIHFPIKGAGSVGYYNPMHGAFALRESLSAGPANFDFRLGGPDMDPLVGTWAGSGPGVGYYDPGTGWFYLRDALSGGHASDGFSFGPPGMTPLVGDWDGSGSDGIGYYDPRTGTFHLRDQLSAGPASYTFRFGQPGMVPLVGNWAGGKAASVGLYNPRTGWFQLREGLASGAVGYAFKFGPRGMIPLAGDWLG
jgi:surface antigen